MPYQIEDELKILDPKKIRMWKDEFNLIKLKIEDNKEFPEIKIVMSFPLSNQEQFVFLYEMDDGKKGDEIGVIEDIGKLDSESKKVIRAELKKEYFMPQITKINNMTEFHGVMKFSVDTDKGSRIFETRYREDIRKMSGGRVVIRDADGNRYEIRDHRKLDQKSMNLIDTEI